MLSTKTLINEAKKIATNIAVSLAQKNKQVLLMDCDLRNPSVVKTLSTPAHPLKNDYNFWMFRC